MEIEQKYLLLKACNLFKDCSEESLYSIAADTYHRSYEKGDIVVSENAAIHKISIIVSEGRMKIYTFNPTKSEEYIVYVLKHGDLFNCIHLFDDKKDYLSAMAMDNLEILHCNIDFGRNWIIKHQAFNKNLLSYLASRLRLAIDYNVSKTFFNIELRLAMLIFQNVSSEDNKLNLINDLSHQEIAQIMGTTRAVVNRNLQKLKKDGLIDIKYKEIVIQNYGKLKSMILEFEDNP